MILQNKQSGPIAWMAKNPVTANLIMLFLLVGGIIQGFRIKQEVFPEFSVDKVQVKIPYPGSSPKDVEQGIVLAVEEAVRGLDGVDEVSSTSREGIGIVNVRLLRNADPKKLTQDVQNEINRITSFPEESEKPQVVLLTNKKNVLSLVVYANLDDRVLREVSEQIRDELLQDPIITQVELSAVKPLEISIEISENTLRKYNLTLPEVARRIKESSLELPAGGMKTKNGEILIRARERRNLGSEFAKLPIIITPDGTQVLLEDMATIKDGFEDIDESALFNGKPATKIDVFRVAKQTPIEISNAVKKHIKILKKILPQGVELAIWNDNSILYKQRVELLMRNAFLGLILVFILLGLFLDIRLGFWVTMGIPISFMGGLLLLPLLNVSINMISLFAFIIALGIVVDDAIIVGENIYEHKSKGLLFSDAAYIGAKEVVVPVTFSVLTNIAAFLPLFFVSGFMGRLFAVIPSVVVLVFIVSLFECLFILPSHLALQKDFSTTGIMYHLGKLQKAFSQLYSKGVIKFYGPLVRLAVKNRYITFALAIFIFTITVGFVESGRIGFRMFSKVQSDFASVTAVLPYGSALEKTKQVRAILLKSAQRVIDENGDKHLVKAIFADIGGAAGGDPGMHETPIIKGGHRTSVMIYLTDPEIRPISTDEFAKKWRKYTPEIKGLESIQFASDAGAPGGGPSLTIELNHRDLDVLEKATKDLAINLKQFPNIKDIDDGFSPGKQQINFQLLDSGKALGLSAENVATQIRSVFYGFEVLRQQRGRNEMKVMLRYPEEDRKSEYTFEKLILKTPKGIEVPLNEVIKINRGRAYTSIERRNGRRAVTLKANVIPKEKTNIIKDNLVTTILPKLMAKYPGLQYSFEGELAEMRKSMRSLMAGFMVAMLLVYMLLAIPLKSYIQPLIILISVPFGIVGAVIGHVIMGYSLSMISMFGVTALSGIVVNDSLILVDFANHEREKGKTYIEAVISAGLRRFRPIMLTTMTTFCGLMPMMMEKSFQARFLIPMAISIAVGILFATVIALILIPCLYIIIEDIKDIFNSKKICKSL